MTYKDIFEYSPLSLWEEDFSEIKIYIDSIENQGIKDFKKYFKENPSELAHCASKIKIININNATLRIYGAKSKKELIDNLDKIFIDDSFSFFYRELMALIKGKTFFEGETFSQTLAGKPLVCTVGLSILPTYKDTWSSVIVHVKDITEQKKLEEEVYLATNKVDRALLEMAKMNQFTKKVNESNNLDIVLKDVFKYFDSEFSIESVILQMVENNELYTYTTTEPPPPNPTKKMVNYARNMKIDISKDNTIIYKVIKQGKPFYVSGVKRLFKSSTIQMQEVITILKLESFLLVPLIIQNNVIGMLLLTSYTKQFRLTKSEINSISFFCDQIAGAIYNSLLVKEIKDEKEKLEIAIAEAEKAKYEIKKLNQVSHIINQSVNLEIILNQVRQYLEEQFNIDAIWLILVDEKECNFFTHKIIIPDKIVKIIGSDVLSSFMNIKVALKKETGTLFHTYNKKKVLYLRRLPNIGSKFDLKIKNTLKIDNLVQIPLIIQGSVIGIMNLAGYKKKNILTKEDIKSINGFCDQIAGAIQSASLIKNIQKEKEISELARIDAEKRSDEIKKLNQVSNFINQTVNLDTILNQIRQYLEDQFNIDSIWLTILNKETNSLYSHKIFIPDAIALKLGSDVIEIFKNMKIALKRENGLIFRTYKKKKAVYVKKIYKSSSHFDSRIMKLLKLKSLLQIPLIIQDAVIGIISLTGFEKEVILTRADIKSINGFCNQIAGAIQSASLIKNIQKEKAISESAQKELLKLNNFSQTISESTNLTHIMEQVSDYIIENFDVNGFWFLNVGRKGKNLITMYYADPLHTLSKENQKYIEDFNMELKPEKGSLWRTFNKKKITYRSRIPNWLQEKFPQDKEIINVLNLKGFIHIPLVIQDTVVGIIALTKINSFLKLSKQEISALSLFCKQISGSIYSASLMKELHKERQKAIVAGWDAVEAKELAVTEQKKSDKLLLNILPKEVADELKEKGSVEPLQLEEVSVLFTDFIGFTKASENMPPNELIMELDGCFTQFDEIISRNKMEKLKTIGDAYMCAGGLPQANTTNVVDACLAALELQAFISQMAMIKSEMSLPFWEIRLGINTGPVTAGVIGQKKFAYDIWGDTVNVASRMESLGLAGKINISRNTYLRVKDFFDCETRGKINVKGKGDVDMYLLSGIKSELSQNKEHCVPNNEFISKYNSLTL